MQQIRQAFASCGWPKPNDISQAFYLTFSHIGGKPTQPLKMKLELLQDDKEQPKQPCWRVWLKCGVFCGVLLFGIKLGRQDLEKAEKFYYVKSLIHQLSDSSEDSLHWVNITDILRDKGMQTFNLGFFTDRDLREHFLAPQYNTPMFTNNINKYNINRRSSEVYFTVPVQYVKIPVERAGESTLVTKLLGAAKRKTDMTDNILKTAITFYAAFVAYGLTQTTNHYFEAVKLTTDKLVFLTQARLFMLPATLILGHYLFQHKIRPAFDFNYDPELPENKYFTAAALHQLNAPGTPRQSNDLPEIPHSFGWPNASRVAALEAKARAFCIRTCTCCKYPSCKCSSCQRTSCQVLREWAKFQNSSSTVPPSKEVQTFVKLLKLQAVDPKCTFDRVLQKFLV